MSHFVKINKNTGVIENGIVVANSDCGGELDFPDSEPLGQQFIKNILKLDGIWKQTSYNHNFRKMYAGLGCIYDFDNDWFMPPKPFNSWVLNQNTWNWEPPIPCPSNDNIYYVWNEEELNWIESDPPEDL
tara:strand:- start:3068 stop:3457 length:390 start_codon:yes stop_codon:yes gene_type:complete